MKKNDPFLWIIALGFFMETLDSTIVNTALPAMAQTFQSSPLMMHSVVIAYSLTLALLIPASGWIADKMGVKKTFLTAITIFTIGSLLCAAATSLHFLVLARIFQGIGGSMLMPVGRLALLRVYPHEKYLAALSFVAMPALVGPLVGPTIGGFLSQALSWHWIFLINLPVGIAGLYCTRRWMPEIPSYSPGTFDMTGFLILSSAMVAISFGLDGVAELGFEVITVTMLMLFGMVAVISYVFHASRSNVNALFSLKIFENRTFAIGLLGNFFARIGSACMPFMIPLFLQVSLGYSPLQSGLTMFPIALTAILSRKPAPYVIQKWGYKRFLMVNTFLVGGSIISFIFVSRNEPEWLRVLQFMFFGGVNSLQFSAMNSLTLKDLEGAETTAGNGLFSMVQMLAISFGVAIAGALLTTFHSRFHGEESLKAFHATFICMGVITLLSAFIFSQLDYDNRKLSNPDEVGVGE